MRRDFEQQFSFGFDDGAVSDEINGRVVDGAFPAFLVGSLLARHQSVKQLQLVPVVGLEPTRLFKAPGF